MIDPSPLWSARAGSVPPRLSCAEGNTVPMVVVGSPSAPHVAWPFLIFFHSCDVFLSQVIVSPVLPRLGGW